MISFLSFFTEAFEDLGVGYKPIDPQSLISYINSVYDFSNLSKKEQLAIQSSKGGKGKDYYTKPHLHPSIAKKVIVKTSDGVTVDLDKFREIVTERPSSLLAQNAKMKKSTKQDNEYVYFNTRLPAFKGLAVNEDTGEFYIVNTCPNAGACLLKCYAKSGFYVMGADATLVQHKTLNYLLNDRDGYKNQLIAEINAEFYSARSKKKKLQIRWNDSGDLLSPKYFDIVLEIVNATPNVEHYVYTKEVNLLKSYENLPNNLIVNYSFGGRQDAFIDKEKDKYSHIVDTTKEGSKTNKKVKVTDIDLHNIISNKFIFKNKETEKWEYKDEQSTQEVKKLIGSFYNIDPDRIKTIDEIIQIPRGENLKYDVIVLPGESDTPAARKDVRATFLMIH